MRDIAGGGITNLIMGGYIWGTEKEFKKVFIKPNYRGYSLMLGANVTNVITGLIVPPPATTLNLSVLPIIAYYLWEIVKLELNVRKQLRIRDDVLNDNEQTLYSNLQKVAGNEAKLNRMLSELMAYDAEVHKYYLSTNDYQQFLADRILNQKQIKEN